MKTQIKLRWKEFTVQDFANGLAVNRNAVSEGRAKELYRGVNTLMNKYYWIDKITQQPLTYRSLDGLLSGNTLTSLIDNSGDADATKKKSFEVAWYLTQALGREGSKYHEKFKEYNRKTKVNRRDTAPVSVISDGLLESFKAALEDSVSQLTVSLTSDSHIDTIMRYQKTILMILLVEYPTRTSSDYYLLRNRDDGKNGYYSNGKIIYRAQNSGEVLVTIDIPSKYLALFENYHAIAKDLSDYFFFGERNKAQVDSNNFPNIVRKLLGVKLSELKHKWDQILESKRGTEEYVRLAKLTSKK